MADKKISALTGATTPLAGTEVLPIVQGGATVKVAVSDLTAGRTVNASFIGVGDTTTPTGVGILNAMFSSDTSSGSNVVLRKSVTATSSPTMSLLKSRGTAAAPTAVSSGDTMAQILAGAYGGTNYRNIAAISAIVDAYVSDTDISSYLTLSTTPTGSVSRLERVRITASGDANIVSGNIVPQTAAKGVNFTANTPAAGMTSQLLNWYEEGTFTATLTGSTGAPTTPVTTTGYYTRVGRQIIVQFDFQGVSTAGATGGLQVTGLPYAAIANRIYAGSAVGNQAYSALQLIASTIDVVTLATGANISAGGGGIFLFCTISYMV